jgi:hypothetical protein
MDDKTLRTWGVALGAGAMAVAVAVAAVGGQGERARATGATGERVEFLVSFKQGGALGDAQALAARGELERAGAAARSALARSAGLNGLCFERFTLGGAEMVLSVCRPTASPVTEGERWLKRLRGMSNVNYADTDVIVNTQTAKP